MEKAQGSEQEITEGTENLTAQNAENAERKRTGAMRSSSPFFFVFHAFFAVDSLRRWIRANKEKGKLANER